MTRKLFLGYGYSTLNIFTQEYKNLSIKAFQDLSEKNMKHVFEKIESSLLHSTKPFNAGIYLPGNGSGLYVSEWL